MNEDGTKVLDEEDCSPADLRSQILDIEVVATFCAAFGPVIKQRLLVPRGDLLPVWCKLGHLRLDRLLDLEEGRLRGEAQGERVGRGGGIVRSGEVSVVYLQSEGRHG